MEGNAHLLQVIRKMRSQINKLERENRALRDELQVCGQRAVPLQREAAGGAGNSDARSLAGDGEGPAGSPAALHGSTKAGPAPAPKEQPDTTMTVRRYSTTSPVPVPSITRCYHAGKRPPSNGLPETLGSAQPAAPPAAAHPASGEEKKGLEQTLASCPPCSHSSPGKLFREHVSKCRSKVKAVSFLLPTDMSSYAEEQGTLGSPPDQSANQLTPLTKKDTQRW